MKTRMNREYEASKLDLRKEFEKLQEIHIAETEKERKRAAASEAKLLRQLEHETKAELKAAKKLRVRPVSTIEGVFGSDRPSDPMTSLEMIRRRRQNITNIEMRRTKRAGLVQLHQMEVCYPLLSRISASLMCGCRRSAF